MRVEVLGCSGGIGQGLRTTSLLVGEHVLIDAGTGLGDLTQAQIAQIRHVFITHSHLDHITCLPFLLDTLSGSHDVQITVYGLVETIAALQQHIFNWIIWPDFSKLPTVEKPILRYETVHVGQKMRLDECLIHVLPAHHVVPAVGYEVIGAQDNLVFTGDTTASEYLWQTLNAMDHIKYLIIETAFGDQEHELALVAKHFSPKLLVSELKKLRHFPQIFISHIKPDEDEVIINDFASHNEVRDIHVLKHQQVFNL